MKTVLLLLPTLTLSVLATADQPFVPNYDESRVPDYTLPDPLRTAAGAPISDAATWNSVRRPEILRLFEQQVYGRAPQPVPIRDVVVSSTAEAVNGKATRREVDVYFGTEPQAPSMRLLIYTPNSADRPVAAFMGLNFSGNHAVDPDPGITLTNRWVRPREGLTDGNRAIAAGRGAASTRWPIEMIIDRGYGLVTIYYGDIDPDFDDGFQNGIHATLQAELESVPPGERWGSIASWAYGLSRALDYLERDPEIDAAKVAVVGHSRLGKTALWAGAADPRFAMVISNNSGCGGAALSRRAVGETVGRINRVFPHWFCDHFNQFNERESACPVDQHQLIALIAPRPVYIASATEDRWADPTGEFLSAVHADPVYRMLGTDGMGGDAPPQKMPAPNSPVSAGTIGYHLRDGQHDITPWDWQQYLEFADRHL